MKIALIGYGKMGREIEKIAIRRGHDIVLKIDITNAKEFTIENLKKADVVIEFTNPDAAANNIKTCMDAGVPVLSGSTGWLAQWQEIEDYCKEKNGALLYASNFSIGVNIFFELNKKLASLMSSHKEYDVSMEEIHHTQKKDAPSGTAITLAEQILEHNQQKKRWINQESSDSEELIISSKRVDPAPGTHSVTYLSAIDEIEIIHTAHNREGFATGAIIGAEFIKGKKGVFSMKDVLAL